MANVWIDDRHPIFRKGLASCLAEAGYSIVGESANLDPVPDPSSLDFLIFEGTEPNLRTARSAAADSAVKTVVLVKAEDVRLMLDAIDLGISSMMLRNELSPSALLGSLRTISHGNSTLPQGVVSKLLDSAAQHPRSHGSASLTKRELSVLRLLADGQDTRGIAGELCYSDRTVKNIVHDVLMKLNCRNRAHAVALVTRQGLI